jgi:hypothetical protein
VTSKKNWRACFPGFAQQAIQSVQQRVASPWLIRAMKQSNLHIENQQCIHSAFPCVWTSDTRAKEKALSITGGPFEVRALLAHGTSHDPPRAVVVVVVEAMRG